MTEQSHIRLTRAQVREVDRRAIEECCIPGVVLMENAGRNAAAVIRGRLRRGGPVAIVCGPGNNGGDGFVIARHLSNAEIEAALFLVCDPARLTGDAATNHRIVERMEMACRRFDAPGEIAAAVPVLNRADVIVDAILGTGFSGTVRSPLDLAVAAVNHAVGPLVVAVDLPSGLDCDTGLPSNATVRADVTVTFVARKTGFDTPGASEYTGEITVADIGAPTSLVHDILTRG